MIAVLPMYDWVEVRGATDALWAALCAEFRAAGQSAPDRLSREIDARAAWTDPRLILGQTCGLPYARTLRDRVTLLGAPDYGVPGCPAGFYRSAFVARGDDARAGLADFRGARLAINTIDSQSGYAALLHHAAPLAIAGRFFGAVEVTGAHERSVEAVAHGRADIAAIDFISWRLIQRFRSAAARLRVLMLSDPTPGLPLIAALGIDAGRHRAIIGRAIDGLDATTRDTLGIRGFVPFEAADYDIIRDRIAAAETILAR